MMVSLLLYGYCVGVPSSRRIEQAAHLFPPPPGAVVSKFTLIASARLPQSGEQLTSAPTLSRRENSVTATELYRMSQILVELFI